MNETSLPRSSLLAIPLIASLVVAGFAVTNQSLWIDEANSALKAIQPSLQGWWEVLAREKGSDLQMPFYMFYLWAWAQIGGHSEIALRLANVPWLVVAQCALWQACPSKRLGFLLLALASINPFLWFYLNEARPYVMQYAAACLLCVILFRAAKNPSWGANRKSLWILVASLLLLCGSSLLGVIWAAFAGIAWLFLIRDQVGSLRQTSTLLPLSFGLVCSAALGVYYIWTIRSGGRASDLGRTGPLNLGFVLYELVGAAGLGPGRLQIRQHGLAAFRDFGPSLLPLAFGFFFSLALLAHALLRVWFHRASRVVIAGCIYSVPPVVCLFALAYAQNFRILGRHFMPLLPVILGLFLYAFLEMRQRRITFALCAALLATWLGSSLSLRFNKRHLKDDYRTAASIAKTALEQQEKVWWSADYAGAMYYGVSLGERGDDTARLVVVPAAADLAQRPSPDLVVASKPDIYDPGDQLGTFLRAHSFILIQSLPAFSIWQQSVPLQRAADLQNGQP